jgi:pimeloyl-ACP methyl ester carboxylesterase
MKPLSTKHAARATTTLACDDDAMLSLVRYGEDTDRAAILCHGFIQNASAWSVPRHSFIDFLVERGLTVYALELRGRCHRGAARHDLLATVEHDAATTLDVVRGRGHRSVAWIGHSMGGLIGCALGGLPRRSSSSSPSLSAAAPSSTHELDAIVAIGSPLIPGRSFLHRRAVVAGVVGFGRFMGRLQRPFAGARYGEAFVKSRALLNTRVAFATPLPLWKPGAFADDADLQHTLKASFADDSHDVLADLVDLVATRGARAGRLPMGEHLARLRAPLLGIGGSVDSLAPPTSVRALVERAQSPHTRFLEVDAGHIDLVVGDRAPELVWRPIAQFLDDVAR